jgi:hypothetical protein
LAGALEIPPDLLAGMEATLRRCHALSGLPGASSPETTASLPEATFLVVYCSSVVNYLLSRRESLG